MNGRRNTIIGRDNFYTNLLFYERSCTGVATERPVAVTGRTSIAVSPCVVQNHEYVDSLASITEVFIGGRIPLIDNPSGRLTFDIQASYTLSGLYANYKSYKYAYEENNEGKMEAKEDRNPQPVAFKLGLSYLFGIGF